MLVGVLRFPKECPFSCRLQLGLLWLLAYARELMLLSCTRLSSAAHLIPARLLALL